MYALRALFTPTRAVNATWTTACRPWVWLRTMRVVTDVARSRCAGTLVFRGAYPCGLQAAAGFGCPLNGRLHRDPSRYSIAVIGPPHGSNEGRTESDFDCRI